jgi:N-ethylmaleimide reductase
VTKAVHEEDGLIYAQLMHAGRIGHPSLLPPGVTPVGPSAIVANANVFTPDGPKSCIVPQELTGDEIAQTINDFVNAALNAADAGFDGVEIHGANGFLIHQFLSTNANRRTDMWGGPAENRIRFAVELSAAVAGAIGSDRVGFQVSPANPYNDIIEDDYQETYVALATELARLNLGYLAVAEGRDRELTRQLRALWPRVFILNPFTAPEVTGLRELQLIEDGTADMIAFGALFLANPDLPRRLAKGGPFNKPDPLTYYGGGDKGYTDYPSLLTPSQRSLGLCKTLSPWFVDGKDEPLPDQRKRHFAHIAGIHPGMARDRDRFPKTVDRCAPDRVHNDPPSAARNGRRPVCPHCRSWWLIHSGAHLART